MGVVATSRNSAVPAALLSCPTALVAAAVRAGAPSIAGVRLGADVVADLHGALLEATGSGDWQLAHFRDTRPLGEMLEVSRMVQAQRRLVHIAA
jgi:hypothetical protein